MPLSKTKIKTIAEILIAKTALAFDGTAFGDCQYLISDDDVQQIISEIHRIADTKIKAIENKFPNVYVSDLFSTMEIVREIKTK